MSHTVTESIRNEARRSSLLPDDPEKKHEIAFLPAKGLRISTSEDFG
jgi:hypothetical protein